MTFISFSTDSVAMATEGVLPAGMKVEASEKRWRIAARLKQREYSREQVLTRKEVSETGPEWEELKSTMRTVMIVVLGYKTNSFP